MIDFSLLTDGGIGWLDASGPFGHLVLSTRIRLARNLEGHLFGTHSTAGDRRDVQAEVVGAARETVALGTAVGFRMDELERVDRQVLHERHLVSRELAGLEGEGRVRPGTAVQEVRAWPARFASR